MKRLDKLSSQHRPYTSPNATEPTPSVLSIRSDRKQYPILLSSIVYIESLDNYVKIHLTDKTLITHESISSLEERLEGTGFVRIHRSYLINKRCIESFSSEGVVIHKVELPFGRAYRHMALVAIGYSGK